MGGGAFLLYLLYYLGHILLVLLLFEMLTEEYRDNVNYRPIARISSNIPLSMLRRGVCMLRTSNVEQSLIIG